MEKGLEGGTPGIQVSGLVVVYDPSRPVGSRVVSLRLEDGEPVLGDTTYSVAVTDHLATGSGDGFTTFGRPVKRKDTGIVDLDALIGYLHTLPQPFRGPGRARFRVARGG